RRCGAKLKGGGVARGCAMMGAVHGNAANARLRAHHSAHCAVVSGASVPNSLRRIAMASGSALGLNGIGWARASFKAHPAGLLALRIFAVLWCHRGEPSWIIGIG